MKWYLLTDVRIPDEVTREPGGMRSFIRKLAEEEREAEAKRVRIEKASEKPQEPGPFARAIDALRKVESAASAGDYQGYVEAQEELRKADKETRQWAQAVAMERLEQEAAKLRASNPGLTRAQAVAKALEANPELSEMYFGYVPDATGKVER